MARIQVCPRRHGQRSRLFMLGCGAATGLFVLAACAQLTWASDGLTEADFFGDVPVVLSASRLSQPLGQTPAAVTIIDRDMIRASGFRDIPDLFRLVPGFTVAYTRDNTWGVGYHGMADGFSRRMQVLIDGRSIYTPGFGEVPWTSLPLSIDDIERIEVVRGPNSAAYGSNAFFGIINIITLSGAEAAGAYASAQDGGRHTRGASVRYGGGEDTLHYRLTLSDQWRDRFNSQPERTRTRFFDFRADYQLSTADDITAVVAGSRAVWRLGLFNDSDEPMRDTDVGADHVQLRLHHVVSPDTDWSLQFYHIRNKQEDPILMPFLGIDIGNIQQRDNLEFQMTTRLSDRTRLVFGAEARHESAATQFYFNGLDARTGALYRLFGNLEWQPAARWIVNGGLMAEHHYLSGLDLSPRLALNYQFEPEHSLRVSISQAYRSPTFFEAQAKVDDPTLVLGILGHGYAASGDLSAERIFSREIGYFGHYRPLRLQVDARLFNDRVRDLIATRNLCATNPALPTCVLLAIGDPNHTPKVFQAANLNHADIRGADLQLRWQPVAWLDLVGSYARVSISSNEEDVRNSSPKNNFSGLAIVKLPQDWQASMGAYRVGRMKWMDDGDWTRAYTRVDARLAKTLNLAGHAAELAVVGQNLGQDYAEFRGDGAKANIFDRRVYGSISLSW